MWGRSLCQQLHKESCKEQFRTVQQQWSEVEAAATGLQWEPEQAGQHPVTELCTWESEPRDSWECPESSGCGTWYASCQLSTCFCFIWFWCSHYFITSQYVAQHNNPMCTMPKPMLVSSSSGGMKAAYICPNCSKFKWDWCDTWNGLVGRMWWGNSLC